MFLKRERPETDDFPIKTYLVLKITSRKSVSRHPLQKTAKNLKMSLHILAFRTFRALFIFHYKHFLSGQGFCPPYLTDMSPKNVSFFFDGSPKIAIPNPNIKHTYNWEIQEYIYTSIAPNEWMNWRWKRNLKVH